MNHDSLISLLRGLRLSAFNDHAEKVAIRAEREGWPYLNYLHHLADLETQDRHHRRIERLIKQSCLPACKTFSTLQQEHFAADIRKKLATLSTGDFLHKAHNVLAFGLPGRGKTHALCALGHKLVAQGYPVLFIPTYKLVQRLLAAKANLRLERELRRLDAFDAVILDDIGYVQQNRDEMEVLFTFLAERYERKSVLITSNLVFSQWDRIFKDPMTTAAAIDRLVHHSTILEMMGTSFRTETAKAEKAEKSAKERAKPENQASDNYKSDDNYNERNAQPSKASDDYKPDDNYKLAMRSAEHAGDNYKGRTDSSVNYNAPAP